MGGEDEDFGNLYVCRSGGCVEDYVGYVGAGQWLDAFVDVAGTFFVTMEAYFAEFGFN